mmetsp:Transcript_51974/g.111191  ORF Transcript_51974/g.111191 Transcript_51974/m.111191 type:complete len:351 (+) Transcript_51974:463-1515(+)
MGRSKDHRLAQLHGTRPRTAAALGRHVCGHGHAASGLVRLSHPHFGLQLPCKAEEDQCQRRLQVGEDSVGGEALERAVAVDRDELVASVHARPGSEPILLQRPHHDTPLAGAVDAEDVLLNVEARWVVHQAPDGAGEPLPGKPLILLCGLTGDLWDRRRRPLPHQVETVLCRLLQLPRRPARLHRQERTRRRHQRHRHSRDDTARCVRRPVRAIILVGGHSQAVLVLLGEHVRQRIVASGPGLGKRQCPGISGVHPEQDLLQRTDCRPLRRKLRDKAWVHQAFYVRRLEGVRVRGRVIHRPDNDVLVKLALGRCAARSSLSAVGAAGCASLIITALALLCCRLREAARPA